MTCLDLGLNAWLLIEFLLIKSYSLFVHWNTLRLTDSFLEMSGYALVTENSANGDWYFYIFIRIANLVI